MSDWDPINFVMVLFGTAWLGLLSLVYKGIKQEISDVRKEIKEAKGGGVTTKECDLRSGALEAQLQAALKELERSRKAFDKGIEGIHERLDKLYTQRRTDKE